MLLPDAKGRLFSPHYGLLGADPLTFAAADTFFCDLVALFVCLSLSHHIGLPKNRIHTQMKILNGKSSDTENNSYFFVSPGYTFSK